jgi:hypothetical protein
LELALTMRAIWLFGSLLRSNKARKIRPKLFDLSGILRKSYKRKSLKVVSACSPIPRWSRPLELLERIAEASRLLSVQRTQASQTSKPPQGDLERLLCLVPLPHLGSFASCRSGYIDYLQNADAKVVRSWIHVSDMCNFLCNRIPGPIHKANWERSSPCVAKGRPKFSRPTTGATRGGLMTWRRTGPV